MQFNSVHSLSCIWLFVTPWTAAHQAPLSITNSRSLLKLMPIKLVMIKHPLFCRRLLLLPLIFPSIRVFSNESVLHIRWPKFWTFRFSISPSNEEPGLISFRVDWFGIGIKNRPTDQWNRVGSPEINPHLHTPINLQIKSQEHVEEKVSSVTEMGKLDSYMQNNQTGALSYTINSKWTKDLKVRPETIKLLGEIFWICLLKQEQQNQK